MRLRFTIIALTCLLATGVVPPVRSGEDDAIRRVITEIITADNQGDVEAVLNLYSANAILLPPGEEPIRGRAAIRERYRTIFATSTLDLASRLDSVRIATGWAVARGNISGTVTTRADRAVQRVDDKFLMLLEHGPDGAWQIAELMWSSNSRSDEP